MKYFNYDNHDTAEGIELLQQARKIYPDQPWLLVTLFELNWKAGNKVQALENVIELLDKHKDTINRSLIAEIYFQMENMDDGFRWLEKSAEIKEPSLVLVANGRQAKHLNEEPRFREIFKKINHPMYVDK